ncbi:hypothetical protein KDU71_00055 [Carboxylicivirga sediminis]|uniref:TonB C-terminal domain-containing protein n=1 Tax=Carboxylicivirga sediminis TaxID=2006564 RepID=A0A941EY35_9BACT|nr:hypothetical protein [Carboxylicivirga sediminis]MBR8533936.1 hypothetical protein [Carboxylicivirga sediminis]
MILPCCLATNAQGIDASQKVNACTCDSLDGQQVLLVAQEMPEYPGGEAIFSAHIAKHLAILNTNKTPLTRVDICFIIDTCGRVRNATIMNVNSIAKLPLPETNILDIINSMPRWKPGKQDGKKVPVKYIIPIRIDLQ